MGYCVKYKMPCSNANSVGFCITSTFCPIDGYNYTNTINYSTNTINFSIDEIEEEEEVVENRYARQCEICGMATEGVSEHLCKRCQNKLYELLYGDNIKDDE